MAWATRLSASTRSRALPRDLVTFRGVTSQSLPLRDRPLTDRELEQMRLILSTFRDGGGQNVLKRVATSMPGFRDFERTVATVCGGEAREDKGVFDVLVPVESSLPFGISCKMSTLQPPAHQAGFMELSNSAAKFNAEFGRLRLSWVHNPAMAGNAVVELVSGWHAAMADEVDVNTSQYLVLAHDSRWESFQLAAFPLSLKLANPATEVEWTVEGKGPSSIAGYIEEADRRHRLWQLFPNSGGQLKYFPPLRWASSASEPFTLELPPAESLRDRAAEYFPSEWARATTS